MLPPVKGDLQGIEPPYEEDTECHQRGTGTLRSLWTSRHGEVDRENLFWISLGVTERVSVLG